jgi:hypothetical protein
MSTSKCVTGLKVIAITLTSYRGAAESAAEPKELRSLASSGVTITKQHMKGPLEAVHSSLKLYFGVKENTRKRKVV